MFRGGETEFEQVVSDIYQAALDRFGWEKTLVVASDFLGAIGGLAAFHDLRVPHSAQNWMTVGRLRPDLTDVYMQRYVDNPYSRAISGQPGGAVLSQNQLVDPAAVARTAFCADILVPQGIREMLVLPYAPWQRGAMTGGLSFAFDVRGADDVRERQRRFARLAPHLLRALDLLAATRADDAALPGLRALIDAAPLPGMLLDGAGRLRHANAQAQALLLEGDGLGAGGRGADDGKRLYASRPADSQRLAAMIARALLAASDVAASGSGATFSVRIGRPSGRPDLAVCAVPLPSSMAPWAGGLPPYVALYVLQPGHAPGGSFARAAVQLGALYDLTAAEQRVAGLVGAGFGLPGAARELGVSVETARTHLRRCFDKTGTRSQVDLARLLALFPAEAQR